MKRSNSLFERTWQIIDKASQYFPIISLF